MHRDRRVAGPDDVGAPEPLPVAVDGEADAADAGQGAQVVDADDRVVTRALPVEVDEQRGRGVDADSVRVRGAAHGQAAPLPHPAAVREGHLGLGAVAEDPVVQLADLVDGRRRGRWGRRLRRGLPGGRRRLRCGLRRRSGGGLRGRRRRRLRRAWASASGWGWGFGGGGGVGSGGSEVTGGAGGAGFGEGFAGGAGSGASGVTTGCVGRGAATGCGSPAMAQTSPAAAATAMAAAIPAFAGAPSPSAAAPPEAAPPEDPGLAAAAAPAPAAAAVPPATTPAALSEYPAANQPMMVTGRSAGSRRSHGPAHRRRVGTWRIRPGACAGRARLASAARRARRRRAGPRSGRSRRPRSGTG
ncbi:hypothetical protein STANM309S_00321 [Streptomyces tanashiensis]